MRLSPTGALRHSGNLFAMALDVVRTLPRRPFQAREFIQQAWFVASVTILPTALVSIPFGAVIAFYLSTEHRAERMEGRPVVALGSDAARQGADVKASFEAGIREYLELLGPWIGEAESEEPSSKAMALLSTMVGAVLLSRAVNDERLSKRLLQAAAASVLTAASADDFGQGASGSSFASGCTRRN